MSRGVVEPGTWNIPRMIRGINWEQNGPRDKKTPAEYDGDMTI